MIHFLLAGEVFLILMDRSSSASEYTDLVCFCVYIYREHSLPKPKVSLPGFGILRFNQAMLAWNACISFAKALFPSKLA